MGEELLSSVSPPPVFRRETGTMARTKPIRFAQDVIDRAEALVSEVGDLPEFYLVGEITRNDVLRFAVLRGLDQLENLARWPSEFEEAYYESQDQEGRNHEQ